MFTLLRDIQKGKTLEKEDLYTLLQLEKEEDIQDLYSLAYETKCRYIGKKVSFRALIEYSNICSKNCFYCGIRKDNKKTLRYQMGEEEVLAAAQWAFEQGFGSLVLQSGEREDAFFIEKIDSLIRKIKDLSRGKLGITLSCGEQTLEVYEKWFASGAHRYLLRIEASEETFYRTLHPEDHSYNKRVQCLRDLRKAGYQTGSGVMFGLPGQKVEHLVDDLLFFREMDLDMIGMGPYIPHPDTLLTQRHPDFSIPKEELLTLSLKMIACTRLLLKDVNIAATTALHTLREDGREQGLKAGGNVIMPNVTLPQYKKSYQLYTGKSSLDDGPENSLSLLRESIEKLGEEILWNQWGDSPHYSARKK